MINIKQKKAIKELTNLSQAQHLYDSWPKHLRSSKLIYKLKKINKNTAVELFFGFEREWLYKINFDIEFYTNHNYKWCFVIGFIFFGIQFDLNIFKEEGDICP